MWCVVAVVAVLVIWLAFIGIYQERRATAARDDCRRKDAELAEVRSRYAAHSKTVDAGHKAHVAAVEKRCAECLVKRDEERAARVEDATRHAAAEAGWRVREKGLQGEKASLKASLDAKATLLAEAHEWMADWMRRGGAFEVEKVASHRG